MAVSCEFILTKKKFQEIKEKAKDEEDKLFYNCCRLIAVMSVPMSWYVIFSSNVISFFFLVDILSVGNETDGIRIHFIYLKREVSLKISFKSLNMANVKKEAKSTHLDKVQHMTKKK